MKAWKLPLTTAIAGISLGAHAVEPQGIALDSGVTLLPAVELSVEDNDNVYLQPEATQESSTVTRLKPSIAVEADMGQTQLRVGFLAEKGIYSADENDNYTDTTFNAGAGFELTSRHQFDVSAELKSAHDARGASTATAQGSSALAVDPDEYDESTLEGSFTYGSSSALLNITAGLERYEKEYKNNFDIGTRDRDYDKTTASLETSVAVSERTGILIDLSTTSIAYDNDSFLAEQREGSLARALVGFSYDVSGKVTSSAKVGASQRSFESDDIDSDTTLTWNVELQWTPRTYSTITVYTAQSANETSVGGGYIDSNYSMVSWDHKFSEYFALTADVSLASDAYYDVNGDTDREDDTLSYGLTGTYSPAKAMDVYANLKQAERDSTSTGLDYEQQVITLGLKLAI